MTADIARLDGITLDGDRALVFRPIDRRVEQRAREAGTAMLAADEEAGHRPHAQLVRIGRRDRGGREDPGVRHARRDCAPAGRRAVDVGDQPDRPAGPYDVLEPHLVAVHRVARGRAGTGRPFLCRQSPEHAPAAGARAGRPEQRAQVVPACGVQGFDRDCHATTSDLRRITTRRPVDERASRTNPARANWLTVPVKKSPELCRAPSVSTG